MKPEIESDTSKVGLRFTINQLLIAITALAIPLALISQYWVTVNNTVDERTIPFAHAPGLSKFYLIGGLILLAVLVISFIGILLTRRLYLTAGICVLTVLACMWPVSRQIESRVISPVRGNQSAEIHNDAAAIVATAVDRFYARTQKWPESWAALDDDLATVIDEIKESKYQSIGPFASGDPFSSNPAIAEESQSIFSRSPDLSSVTPEGLRTQVDINFDADPRVLAKEDWMEFTGIDPHKPTYNTYRVEFGKLIRRLNEPGGSTEVPNETAK